MSGQAMGVVVVEASVDSVDGTSASGALVAGSLPAVEAPGSATVVAAELCESPDAELVDVVSTTDGDETSVAARTRE